jgi:hypothetical protein
MTQPKIHEDENADHQKGEAMDCRLLAIADGFGEGIGKVRETSPARSRSDWDQ